MKLIVNANICRIHPQKNPVLFFSINNNTMKRSRTALFAPWVSRVEEDAGYNSNIIKGNSNCPIKWAFSTSDLPSKCVIGLMKFRQLASIAGFLFSLIHFVGNSEAGRLAKKRYF